MNIEQQIDELKEIICEYEIESFAGFFAYFIRENNIPPNTALAKFKSRLKDFFYLISLNAFSESKGTKIFDLSVETLDSIAERVSKIKKKYYPENFLEYTLESALHEMAFMNYFDNGVLSYVEQDIERVKSTFSPFESKIIEDFGFDINFFIEIYYFGEKITQEKHYKLLEYTFSEEFIQFSQKVGSGKVSYEEAFELLPKNIQDDFLSFQSKTHAYLTFQKDELYEEFPKEKVDCYLKLLAFDNTPRKNIRYYAAENPLEMTPILRISENEYLHICQKQIPISIYRHFYNHLVGDKQYHDKIRKHREKCLEKKVVELFKTFFPSKETFFYENYYVKDNCEQDLLILYKGSAIIIEIKASKLREPFRDIPKAIIRLKDDFKQSIQYGYEQCLRVEDYFLDETPFDIKDGRNNILYQVRPNKIHSVYSIVVTLERLGYLQTDLGLLLQKEDDLHYPWSVYIDDLEVFLIALKYNIKNPTSRFFDYLKARRTMHKRVHASDELDICADFLNDPEKFKSNSKKNQNLLTFSPFNQRLFDQLYFEGKLRFSELK